jgi:hypothetical protein
MGGKLGHFNASQHESNGGEHVFDSSVRRLMPGKVIASTLDQFVASIIIRSEVPRDRADDDFRTIGQLASYASAVVMNLYELYLS